MGLAAFNRMRLLRAKQDALEKQKSKDNDNVIDLSKLKVDEIKAKLTEFSIEFDPTSKKGVLLDLLKEHLNKNDGGENEE